MRASVLWLAETTAYALYLTGMIMLVVATFVEVWLFVEKRMPPR